MPKLKDLTKKEWSRIKKKAGIEKNKNLLKQDANVGKYVQALEKARNAWKPADPAQRALLAYLSALDKLKKAFTDFERTKDLEKAEAASLKKELGDWKTEIDKKSAKLMKVYSKFPQILKMGDKKQVNAILEDCGLGGIM